MTALPRIVTRTLAVMCVVGALATHAVAAPAAALTGYSVRSWAESDAGPLGAVSAIVQDGDGYLWIGTSVGLLRFDGTRFTHWDALGESPLPRSPVTALRIARDGTLWVGLDNRAGVARIRGRSVDLIDPGPLRVIMAIVEDRDGTIWAASDPSLYRLAERRWERVPVFDAGLEVRVVNADVTRDGTLWAGATAGLFVTRDGGASFTKLANDWVWSASEDAAGTLWLTDVVRGFRPAGSVSNPRSYVEGNGYRVLHDRRGDLWVATIGEGLWRIADARRAPGHVEKALLDSAVFSDSVQSFLEDRGGNLWVGTTAGLHRLTRQTLTPLTNIGLVTAAEARGDELWAATSYGLVRFTRNGEAWSGKRIGGPTVYAQAVHRSRDSALWVGGTEGLFEEVAGVLRRVDIPPSTGLMAVPCIASDSRNTLWLTGSGRIVRWDRRRFTPLALPTDAPDGRPVCTFIDSRDRAWIGFPGAHLLLRDPDGGFTRLGPETFGGAASAIYNVSQTADGAVWVATNVGVTRFRQDGVVTFTRANGLPSDRVWTVVDDEHGFVWLSLDLGLARIHPDELERAAADRAYRIRFELLDTSEGLAGAPILRVRSGRGSGGTLWFVRGGALTVTDVRVPGDALTAGPGRTRIERASVDDRTVDPAPELALSSGTKRLEIHYTAIALTQPGRVRFRYRLEGFDSDWIQAGTRRTAVYTNLPPRAYRFVVQAGTDHEGWNSTQAAWPFRIRPAFYQTAWFSVLTAAAAGLLVWAAWRFRVRLVHREYAAVLAERSRLSREIHDTLLQGVVGVALQLDALAHSIGAISTDARDALVRTRRQVEAYIREARQSISDLRSPLLEAKTLAQVLEDIGREATLGTLVRFSVVVTGKSRQCSPRLENELLRIAQEAVTNAMRHAHPRAIRLELRYLADSIALSVVDDGCGFAAPRDEHAAGELHYGLIVMKERAENLGGRVSIAPIAEGGTRIEAVLPAPATA